MFLFFTGDLFHSMCGYRGYYIDQAMIHFDSSHLHSELKINNRKTREEAAGGVQKNVDNGRRNNSKYASGNDDKAIDGNEQTDDDYHETNPGDQLTLEDNDTTTDSGDHDPTSSSDDSSTNNDDKTILNPDTRTNEDVEKNDETGDDEYGYYNPKDIRRWKEKE